MNKSLATQLFESYIKNREYSSSSPYEETRDYILSDKFQKEIIKLNNFFLEEIFSKLKERSNNQECSFTFKCTNYSNNVISYVLNSHGFLYEIYNKMINSILVKIKAQKRKTKSSKHFNLNNDNETYCMIIWGEVVFNFFES